MTGAGGEGNESARGSGKRPSKAATENDAQTITRTRGSDRGYRAGTGGRLFNGTDLLIATKRSRTAFKTLCPARTGNDRSKATAETNLDGLGGSKSVVPLRWRA